MDRMNVCRPREVRILFIAGGTPWPVHVGANQRTNLLLRALRQCGPVETVIHSRYVDPSAEDMAHLREAYGVVARFALPGPGDRWLGGLAGRLSQNWADRLGTHIGGMGLWYQPQSNIVRWLSRRLQEHHYDLIVGRYLRALASAGAFRYQPLVLDLDDYDCAAQRSRLQQPGLSRLKRYSIRRQIRGVETVVPGLLRQCDHIWVASPEDQRLLDSFPTSILPNIPFEPEGAEPVVPCPPRPASTSILMVGSWRHTVNVNAIDRFLKTVWPQVHAAVPQSEFRVVGYGMTEEQKRRWDAVPGVVPVGFVEELRQEYDRCAFTVVPIFEGGGTKIKVLESLRHGRTVVAASHSCRGYEDVLQHLDAAWIAPDEAAIAAGCIRLLKESVLRDRMAERGCRLVRQHYSYDRVRQVVCEAIGCVAIDGKGVRIRA
jgi:glycosyltransferase involved in cell wall biosynthesis